MFNLFFLATRSLEAVFDVSVLTVGAVTHELVGFGIQTSPVPTVWN